MGNNEKQWATGSNGAMVSNVVAESNGKQRVHGLQAATWHATGPQEAMGGIRAKRTGGSAGGNGATGSNGRDHVKPRVATGPRAATRQRESNGKQWEATGSRDAAATRYAMGPQEATRTRGAAGSTEPQKATGQTT